VAVGIRHGTPGGIVFRLLVTVAVGIAVLRDQLYDGAF
jgi:hypothetical protein